MGTIKEILIAVLTLIAAYFIFANFGMWAALLVSVLVYLGLRYIFQFMIK